MQHKLTEKDAGTKIFRNIDVKSVTTKLKEEREAKEAAAAAAAAAAFKEMMSNAVIPAALVRDRMKELKNEANDTVKTNRTLMFALLAASILVLVASAAVLVALYCPANMHNAISAIVNSLSMLSREGILLGAAAAGTASIVGSAYSISQLSKNSIFDVSKPIELDIFSVDVDGKIYHEGKNDINTDFTSNLAL